MQVIGLPLIVLGYDRRRLFSVADEAGITMLPVFRDAEKARNYRNYYHRYHQLDLQTLILEEPEKAVNLFENVLLLVPDLKYIIVDPVPPTIHEEKAISFKTWEFIQSLKNLLSQASSRNNRKKRKGKSRNRPRTQRDL